MVLQLCKNLSQNSLRHCNLCQGLETMRRALPLTSVVINYKYRSPFLRNQMNHIRFISSLGFRIRRSILGEDVKVNSKKSLSISAPDLHQRRRVQDGPSLADFIKLSPQKTLDCDTDSDNATKHYLPEENYLGNGRKVYFETYGCQMNVNDTEIVWAILDKAGFSKTQSLKEADVVLLMTCSIREGAEKKIWNRVDMLNGIAKSRGSSKGRAPMKIGILGCMAERLKEQILEKKQAVDLVCGPDAYKDLPRLLSITHSGQTAVNVLLSLEETYADVMPIRINPDSPSAFVSIMRGCDNMCSYCIVPFTRGRERSRPISSILDEVKMLRDQGIKEVTLLGQNVNSFRDLSEQNSVEEKQPTNLARGFKTIYRTKMGGLRFADLLDKVSLACPDMRIRFTSPHPKDFPDEVLDLIQERANICNQIHIPAQSGSSQVLASMRRGYTREGYIELIEHIKSRIPDIRLSSDFIAGFCGESEEDHLQTLSLLEHVRYHRVFHFPYSLREKTHAHRRLTDDVLPDVKQRRHEEIAAVTRDICAQLNALDVGKIQLVLVESDSKRSNEDWSGRNDGNTKVIFPKASVPMLYNDKEAGLPSKAPIVGDFVAVKIEDSTSHTLRGRALFLSSLQSFSTDLSSYILQQRGTENSLHLNG